MSSQRTHRWVTGCLLCTVMAACADPSSGPSAGSSVDATRTSPPTAPSTAGVSTAGAVSTSPTGSPDVRTTAVAVYLAMWADMVEAAKTSDYTSPRLDDHAAAQALILLSGALRKAHDSQLVVKGTPRFSPRVIGQTPPVNPTAVSVQDCMDDSDWLNYRPDGRLQNDVPGGRHRATATVGFLNGRWVVTRLQIGEVGTCT